VTLPGRLVVVGAGLIGGSVAAGARSSGYARHVVGVDANGAALEEGRSLGILDAVGLPADLGPDDLVVVATPTLSVPGVIAELGRTPGAFAGGATVTDVASVKASVVEAVASLPDGAPPGFVPGHPIAGSERSGIGAARGDLFRHRRVILTPLATTEAAALVRVRALWEALGADVSTMEVTDHDRVLAMTSHLPHLLAFALVDTLGREPEHESIFGLAAGGFRDFTRIASSDPVMWADIFAANGPATVAILDRLQEDLGALRGLLETGDRDALLAILRRAKRLRDEHVLGLAPMGEGGVLG
jgi:prephenate dehydrogenase